MSTYLALKLVHLVSAAVLFGTGLGIAYFFFSAHRSRDLAALRVTARHVIVADWLFTAIAVMVQPLTGWLLMREIGMSFDTAWFRTVAALYLFVGACWIPVVVLQYRMAAYARAVDSFADLPGGYYRCFNAWCALGVPAFATVLVLYALMVFKPGLG